jgi:pyruvate/2-oxoglutarate dehydrogenase complex dihydrolipoamide acyltransferase (E2) component
LAASCALGKTLKVVTVEANNYQVLPFPASRRVVIDAGRLGSRRHIVFGLVEWDVTHARVFLREHKRRTGESLSFTAFIVWCLAQAIRAHPFAQAYRNWRNQLILFDDVDVVTLIEAEKNCVAIPHIVRGANRKSFRDIHTEIRAIQAAGGRSEQEGGLGKASRLPGFVRDLFYWALCRNPHWLKKYAGTVVVTSVGMFGKGGGWGLGFLPLHTLGLTLGGIAEKPVLIDGQLTTREYLSITISVDHDVVDGAPAARFAQGLKELVESGYGLCTD